MTRGYHDTRVVTVAGICALGGGAATVWGWLFLPQSIRPAWLAAFYFWLGVPLGALALLLIHDLTGGAWERTARPTLEAAARTLPLFILLFLPIAANLPGLYVWARPGDASTLPNSWYLNPGFFALRAVLYFAVWLGFLALKLSWPAPALPSWLAAIGTALLGLSVSFAAIDWILSIEPRWFSTIFGMIAGASQFIASLSVALVVIAIMGKGRLDDRSYRDGLASLATILLAVVIFWAYASFCQYLIVWEENLSSEIDWYIERWRGAWADAIYGVALAHFLLPLAALVTTPAKRSRAIVGSVACVLLAANLVQIWWLVLPPFGAVGFTWLAFAVAIFMGGAWLLAFVWAQRASRTWSPASARFERLGHG